MNKHDYWKGKKRSQETIEKIRKANSGKIVPLERKIKISNSMKGRTPWNKGKKCPNISKSMKGRTSLRKGIPHSEETKNKLSKALKGKTAWNKGKKLHYPVWNKGKKLSKETIEKISSKMRGKVLTKEHKKRISEGLKNIPLELRNKITKKVLGKRGLSSLEKKFMETIVKFRLPYKFVGDGKFFIEKKNPDFINCNGEKIAIEVYCTRHKNIFRGDCMIWMKNRQKIFEKYGWKIEFFNEWQINDNEIIKRLG